MFALEAHGEIYLRVDGETRPAFAARGLEPFVHDSPRGDVVTPYRKLAPEAHEDDDELARWSRLAPEAARRVRQGRQKGNETAKRARKSPRARKAVRPRRVD